MSSTCTSLGRADFYGIVLLLGGAAAFLLLIPNQFYPTLPLETFWIFLIVETCTGILTVVMSGLQGVHVSFTRSRLWIALSTILAVQIILELSTHWKIGWDLGSFIQYGIAVGPVEELVFRGYLLTTLALMLNVPLFELVRLLGTRPGLKTIFRAFAPFIIANVVFALYHIPIDLASGQLSIPGFLDRIFFGLAMSALYSLTKNLALPMVVHGLFDYDLGFIGSSNLPLSNFFLLLLVVGPPVMVYLSRNIRRHDYGAHARSPNQDQITYLRREGKMN